MGVDCGVDGDDGAALPFRFRAIFGCGCLLCGMHIFASTWHPHKPRTSTDGHSVRQKHVQSRVLLEQMFGAEGFFEVL